MFSIVRWLSLFSFVVVIGAIIFANYYLNTVVTKNLTQSIQESNVSLAKGVLTTTWKWNREQLNNVEEQYRRFRASGVDEEQWKNYRGFREMQVYFNASGEVLARHFEDTVVTAINIYLADKTPILSVRPVNNLTKQVQSVKFKDNTSLADADRAFEMILSGGKASSVLWVDPVEGSKLRIVKTFIPLSRDGSIIEVNGALNKNSIDVVLEIDQIASEQFQDIEQLRTLGLGASGGFTLILIITLILMSNRAETMIARQHEQATELTAQVAKAQTESRDKSQFLANISHELRTPLNAIIGFSEFIQAERSGPIGNEKYGEYIRDIHTSGVHLLSLINDILDYSKAEANKLDVEISEVDVTKTVKNSMRLVGPRAETAQIELIDKIPREHFILITDAKKLKQAVLNLLSNAVKFTPQGGSVTVSMWENIVNGAVSIEVKDTGIGIAPKDISRAMASFVQVDNKLSRKYEGTGLGLPLTRKFVELMGGEFQIQSEVGVGTTITIILPKAITAKGTPAEVETKVANDKGAK